MDSDVKTLGTGWREITHQLLSFVPRVYPQCGICLPGFHRPSAPQERRQRQACGLQPRIVNEAMDAGWYLSSGRPVQESHGRTVHLDRTILAGVTWLQEVFSGLVGAVADGGH